MNAPLLLVATVSLTALAACAGEPPPRSLAQARQAVEMTTASPGVAESAPNELAMARERLDAATAAAARDRNVEADRLAQEAIANAQLAQARAEEARARSALDEMRRR